MTPLPLAFLMQKYRVRGRTEINTRSSEVPISDVQPDGNKRELGYIIRSYISGTGA